MRHILLAAALILPLPTLADDVTDTIDAARQAYEDGDLAYAMEELTFAMQLMKQMKAGSLAEMLPPAQDGWTREIDEEEGRALGMMGGTGAVATYSDGAQSFDIQIVADSPMVATFAGVFGNTAMMASIGKVIRVGREKFIDEDGDLTGVIGNRVLVQASGLEETAAMIAHLETIDFSALESFGQ